MKKMILFALLMMLSSVQLLFAQQKGTPIDIEKGFEASFYQNGARLNMAKLSQIMQDNTEAMTSLGKAKTNKAFATVFGFAGGFCVGWPLGTALGGGDPEWAMLGIGAGLIVISIPLTIAYSNHATNAVNLYNESIGAPAKQNVSMQFGMTPNGLGLTMRF